MYEYWFKQGEEYTPIEFNEDGSLKSVIVGICIMTSLDEMKKRAKKIWEVDDLYEPTKATLVYEKAGTK